MSRCVLKANFRIEVLPDIQFTMAKGYKDSCSFIGFDTLGISCDTTSGFVEVMVKST